MKRSRRHQGAPLMVINYKTLIQCESLTAKLQKSLIQSKKN